MTCSRCSDWTSSPTTRCRASACSASRCSTGAPSTAGYGRCNSTARNAPAHRRHRLGQVDAGGRGHHAAGAGAPHRLQQGRRRRQQGTHAALLRARPLQVRAQRGDRHRQAGGPARPQQLLGDPGRVSQRRLRPDGDAGAGLLDEGAAGPAGAFLRRRRERDLSIADDFARLRLRHRRTCARRLRAAAPRCTTAFRPTAPGSAAASASTTSRRWSCSTRPCR